MTTAIGASDARDVGTRVVTEIVADRRGLEVTPSRVSRAAAGLPIIPFAMAHVPTMALEAEVAAESPPRPRCR